MILSDNFYIYSTWADRALSRAADLLDNFQVYGSEYSARQGARTPGGALYYYIFLLLGIHSSALFVYAATAALHFLFVVLLYITGRNLHSALAGAIAALAYLSSLALGDVSWQMWNPFFALPFGLLGYYFFFRAVQDKGGYSLALAAGALGIAAQMHITYFALIVAMLGSALAFAPSIRFRHIMGAVAALLVVYSPWLLSHAIDIGHTDIIPSQFFPGFSGVETNTGPIAKAHVAKFDLPLAIWIEKGMRIGLEMLSFADTNHVRIDFPTAVLGFTAFALLALPRNASGADGEATAWRRHAAILITIVVFGTFIVFAIGNVIHGIGVKLEIHRYISHFLPASALLAGIVIAALWQHRNHSRARTIFIHLVALGGIVGVLVKGGLVLLEDYKTHASDGKHRASWILYTDGSGLLNTDKLALFADIRDKWGNIDLVNRLASAAYNGDWSVAVTPSEFLIDKAGDNGEYTAFDGCLLALWKDGPLSGAPIGKAEAEEAVEAMSSKSGLIPDSALRNATIIDTIDAPKYYLVHYRLSTNGCVKTFGNPYMLSQLEAQAESLLQNKDVKLAEVTADDGKRVFFVKHNVPGTRYQLNLAVVLDQAADGTINATIESKQLNSSFATLDGYWEPLYIEAPTVVLENKDSGETIPIMIYDHVLGGNSTLTPWQSQSVSVPRGNYRVRLTARAVGRVWALHDTAGLWNTGSRPRVEVVLTDSFVVGGN